MCCCVLTSGEPLLKQPTLIKKPLAYSPRGAAKRVVPQSIHTPLMEGHWKLLGGGGGVLRWLPRDFTKVTIGTGIGNKRNSSSRLAIFVPETRQ